MTHNKLALVVEDDALNLVAISSLLNRMRIRYKRNTTGAQVVQQAQYMNPDFILLDMDLPDGDPFMICEAIHADPSLRHIPVIATGDESVLFKSLPRIRASQFAGYIPKPVCQKDLDGLLHSVLGAKLV
jgi:two-component system cell cycle response regulator DivK